MTQYMNGRFLTFGDVAKLEAGVPFEELDNPNWDPEVDAPEETG